MYLTEIDRLEARAARQHLELSTLAARSAFGDRKAVDRASDTLDALANGRGRE